MRVIGLKYLKELWAQRVRNGATEGSPLVDGIPNKNSFHFGIKKALSKDFIQELRASEQVKELLSNLSNGLVETSSMDYLTEGEEGKLFTTIIDFRGEKIPVVVKEYYSFHRQPADDLYDRNVRQFLATGLKYSQESFDLMLKLHKSLSDALPMNTRRRLKSKKITLDKAYMDSLDTKGLSLKDIINDIKSVAKKREKIPIDDIVVTEKRGKTIVDFKFTEPLDSPIYFAETIRGSGDKHYVLPLHDELGFKFYSNLMELSDIFDLGVIKTLGSKFVSSRGDMYEKHLIKEFVEELRGLEEAPGNMDLEIVKEIATDFDNYGMSCELTHEPLNIGNFIYKIKDSKKKELSDTLYRSFLDKKSETVKEKDKAFLVSIYEKIPLTVARQIRNLMYEYKDRTHPSTHEFNEHSDREEFIRKLKKVTGNKYPIYGGNLKGMIDAYIELSQPELSSKELILGDLGFSPQHLTANYEAGTIFELTNVYFWDRLGALMENCPEKEQKRALKLLYEMYIIENLMTRNYSLTAQKHFDIPMRQLDDLLKQKVKLMGAKFEFENWVNKASAANIINSLNKKYEEQLSKLGSTSFLLAA